MDPDSPIPGRAAELKSRRRECDVLDRLVDAVRAGESQALVLRGEATRNEVVVIANMKVMPDRREPVRAALLRQVGRVHVEEPGAQRFAAHETDDGFVLIEKWDSEHVEQ